MRTAVVALIALAALAWPSMSVAAEEPDRRPRDLHLEPLVDGSTRITWSAPEAGPAAAYHVFRAVIVPASEADWIPLGTTDADFFLDPEHRLEDDAIQGYRVVAEFADGAGVAELYGVVRFPPSGALATIGQGIIRLHASGKAGCYLIFVGDIPPTQTVDEVPCWFNGVASFLPGPVREPAKCGFSTAWNVVRPAIPGAGAGLGGASQQMGGEGCVQA